MENIFHKNGSTPSYSNIINTDKNTNISSKIDAENTNS
jgi:hypothetical protein